MINLDSLADKLADKLTTAVVGALHRLFDPIVEAFWALFLTPPFVLPIALIGLLVIWRHTLNPISHLHPLGAMGSAGIAPYIQTIALGCLCIALPVAYSYATHYYGVAKEKSYEVADASSSFVQTNSEKLLEFGQNKAEELVQAGQQAKGDGYDALVSAVAQNQQLERLLDAVGGLNEAAKETAEEIKREARWRRWSAFLGAIYSTAIWLIKGGVVGAIGYVFYLFYRWYYGTRLAGRHGRGGDLGFNEEPAEHIEQVEEVKVPQQGVLPNAGQAQQEVKVPKIGFAPVKIIEGAKKVEGESPLHVTAELGKHIGVPSEEILVWLMKWQYIERKMLQAGSKEDEDFYRKYLKKFIAEKGRIRMPDKQDYFLSRARGGVGDIGQLYSSLTQEELEEAVGGVPEIEELAQESGSAEYIDFAQRQSSSFDGMLMLDGLALVKQDYQAFESSLERLKTDREAQKAKLLEDLEALNRRKEVRQGNNVRMLIDHEHIMQEELRLRRKLADFALLEAYYDKLASLDPGEIFNDPETEALKRQLSDRSVRLDEQLKRDLEASKASFNSAKKEAKQAQLDAQVEEAVEVKKAEMAEFERQQKVIDELERKKIEQAKWRRTRKKTRYKRRGKGDATLPGDELVGGAGTGGRSRYGKKDQPLVKRGGEINGGTTNPLSSLAGAGGAGGQAIAELTKTSVNLDTLKQGVTSSKKYLDSALKMKDLFSSKTDLKPIFENSETSLRSLAGLDNIGRNAVKKASKAGAESSLSLAEVNLLMAEGSHSVAQKALAQGPKEASRAVIKEKLAQAVGGAGMTVVTDYGISALGTGWNIARGKNEAYNAMKDRQKQRFVTQGDKFSTRLTNLGDAVATTTKEIAVEAPPVQEVVAGAVGGSAGAWAGGAVGLAVAGPVGATAGAFVGGAVTGAVSKYLFAPAEAPNIDGKKGDKPLAIAHISLPSQEKVAWLEKHGYNLEKNLWRNGNWTIPNQWAINHSLRQIANYN